jgi:hypothetical protein
MEDTPAADLLDHGYIPLVVLVKMLAMPLTPMVPVLAMAPVQVVAEVLVI